MTYERVAEVLGLLAADLVKEERADSKTFLRHVRDWLDETDPEQKQFVQWIRAKIADACPDIAARQH